MVITGTKWQGIGDFFSVIGGMTKQPVIEITVPSGDFVSVPPAATPEAEQASKSNPECAAGRVRGASDSPVALNSPVVKAANLRNRPK
jgi:hypothetical protein